MMIVVIKMCFRQRDGQTDRETDKQKDRRLENPEKNTKHTKKSKLLQIMTRSFKRIWHGRDGHISIFVLQIWLKIMTSIASRPKASNGQRYPCPALMFNFFYIFDDMLFKVFFT